LRSLGGAVHFAQAAGFVELVERNTSAIVFDGAAAASPVNRDVDFGGLAI
jgi:hypothetical protein